MSADPRNRNGSAHRVVTLIGQVFRSIRVARRGKFHFAPIGADRFSLTRPRCIPSRTVSEGNVAGIISRVQTKLAT